MISPRRQSATTSTSESSVGGDRPPSVSPGDWKELLSPELNFGIKERESSADLQVPHSTKSRRRWPIRLSRRCYYLVGLSPNCKLAFVMDKGGLYVYCLGEPPDLRPKLRAELSIELFRPYKDEVVDAVLSDRHLAAVDRYRLYIFELDYGVYGDKVPFSTLLENQTNESSWVPTCLTIFDNNEGCAWVAVGFRVKKDYKHGGDIKVYRVETSGVKEEIGRYDKAFRSTIAKPLESEFVRSIVFSPDGDRLACVTNNNTVLVWSWSQRGEWRHPFEIQGGLIPDAGGKGILTSVTLFRSPSKNPYVLCTTSPSSERGRTGEWSFICPAPLVRSYVPAHIKHTIQPLRGSVLVGAATSVGELIAVLEDTGTVRLLALDSGRDGGIRCHAFQDRALEFDSTLSPQQNAHPTSLRFQESSDGLYLFAVDLYGKVIAKPVMRGAYPPLTTLIPDQALELNATYPIRELDSPSLNQNVVLSASGPMGEASTGKSQVD